MVWGDSKMKKCSLCEGEYKDYGHNPEPLKDFKERCCDECNKNKVIPARLFGPKADLNKLKVCHRCEQFCGDSIPINCEDDNEIYYLCEACDKLMGWQDE